MNNYLTLTTEIKAGQSGDVAGYGSIFGNVDQGGDIVAKGAFADSLASGRGVKMLWQHNPDQPIGIWDSVKEDATGLRVAGRFLTSTTDGKNAYELTKAGAIDGLSIGYRTVKASDQNGVRVIEKADLWEVSVVTFPMNTEATIDAVKAAEMTERELERVLTQDARLTRSVARAVMRDGFKGICKQDAVNGLDELARIITRNVLLKSHIK